MAIVTKGTCDGTVIRLTKYTKRATTAEEKKKKKRRGEKLETVKDCVYTHWKLC
jgi:hypothetical protein